MKTYLHGFHCNKRFWSVTMCFVFLRDINLRAGELFFYVSDTTGILEALSHRDSTKAKGLFTLRVRGNAIK